jgi:hypothetical protein
MKYLFTLVPFVSAILALPAPQSGSSQDSSLVTAVCDGNTADDRTVWCEHSIDTDWYNEVPDTGVTREVCCLPTSRMDEMKPHHITDDKPSS